MKDLILDGHSTKKGAKRFISEFEAWKASKGAIVVSAQEAWDYQQQKIALHERIEEQAAETIGKMKQIIDELKKFNEENLKIIGELEIENIQLKEESDGKESS